MIGYNQSSVHAVQMADKVIEQFPLGENMDQKTVDSFGEEWTAFHTFSEQEIKLAGDNYFDIVPAEALTKESNALDVGCGTGRWSYYISSLVGSVECIDPSKAVLSAAHLLKEKKNTRIANASVDNIPFPDHSFDLVFSLGVLHHVPDTADAIKKCVRKVKREGYLLLYLYYNLENRGFLFKALFYLSNSIRWVVSKLPAGIKKAVCNLLAVLVYMPFVFVVRILQKGKVSSAVTARIPLSWYADKSFHIIRNDALDRFGTPLEQRFSKEQITAMLQAAGCKEIVFADNAPFWRVVAKKK